MTSIATRAGAVIIKDGGAAEDCSCCGGAWQCCVDRSCTASEVKSVTVEVIAGDYFLQTEVRSSASLAYLSTGIRGSELSGTHTLPFLSVSGSGRKYFFGTTLAMGGTQCAMAINVGISNTGFDWTISYAGLAYLAYPLADVADRYKSLDQLQCSQNSVVNKYTYEYSPVGFNQAYFYGLCSEVSASLFVPFTAKMERCLPGGTSNESNWVNKVENGSLDFSIPSMTFNW